MKSDPLQQALPWVAAFLVLLAVLVVRWPEPVLGEDQKAVDLIPAVRAEVDSARRDFIAAEDAYKSYVRTTNMGLLLQTFKTGLPEVRAEVNNGTSPELQSLLDASTKLSAYVAVLESYAQTGEQYLAVMRRYDDLLMAWTRSLGAASEGLRDDTFPIVEHLKLYPPPTGLHADPSLVTAAQVSEQGRQLREAHRAVSTSTTTGERRAGLDALEKTVNSIWDSGRSIEYIESLHERYNTFLGQYSEAVTRVSSAQSGAARLSLPSLAANLAVGLALFAGLGLLFSARTVRSSL